MSEANSPGTRTTLVLLPGLLCDGAVWIDQCRSLERDAECVVADYGMADSITAMAQCVLTAVSAPRFALAGHSMGGRVALEVVRQAPERVSHLALMDTGYQALASGEAGEREVNMRQALVDVARRQGMRTMGLQWAPGMVHPERRKSAVFEDILQMIERSTPERFAAQQGALIQRPDATALLGRITCPTLLLCGRQDEWSPVSRHEEMQKLIPGSRLCVIEDSGHMTTMEQPRAVAEAMANWLKEQAQ